MPSYKTYLRTLRRVPDDVILATATREFDMSDGHTCLCGWFMRERFAAMAKMSPETVSPYYAPDDVEHNDWIAPDERCMDTFGGTSAEWHTIYSGVNYWDVAPHIERAFVERVKEAAGVA